MTLDTNLNSSPYFDDFDENKNYYKVLFKPSFAVQTREMNQLQTILQHQIEKFGDNILNKGTIIDGCNFIYYDEYPYIKINDIQKDGILASPSKYVGLYAKSANSNIDLKSFITNHDDGFETTAPDLKTLYLNYINSGKNGTTTTYLPGEVITLYDPKDPIFSIKVNNGGIGFTNNDILVSTSAIVVNVASGSFANGEYLYQSATGANVQIIEIDTTTLAFANQVILSVRPRISDLANGAANSSSWTISNLEPIRNAAATINGTVEGIIGSNVDGVITTDSTGKIIDVVVTEQGQGYSKIPFISVKSANNTTGLTSLNFSAQNFYANVQLTSTPDATGSGYAFGVSPGWIYQKGYFARVEPQTIVVSKYTTTPDKLVAGFDTKEEIVNSNIDPDLLDNALGTKNENAPGADRLKLIPELTIIDSDVAKANSDFFVLTEWSEGRPFKQNQLTSYNKINDEMAIRTRDESGNFSVDRFNVATKSPSNTLNEGLSTTIMVDPGLAYIDGYRVKTYTNYSFDIQKGEDFKTSDNQIINIDYDNYIQIKEIGGVFQFNTGDIVTFYNTAKNFISNTVASSTGNTNPVGSVLGTARVRSLSYTQGFSENTYKLYLFDVKMSPGKNFKDARSVYYGGVNKGIADLILKYDQSINANIAFIEGSQKDSLVFKTYLDSIKSMSSTNYTYKTIDQTLTCANNTGTITKDISSIINEAYPYSSTVSNFDLKQMYAVSTSNNLTAANSVTGSVSVNTTSANISGTGTTFLSDLQTGDFVNISNGTLNFITKIKSIVNNTLFVAASNASFTNATNTFVYRIFPKNVPIQLGSRSVVGQIGHTANVNANGNILVVQMKHANGQNMTFNSSTSVAANIALSVNIERRNSTPSTMTANRSAFVKIYAANNVGKTNGPWCLGVPNAFRLRGVYIGNSTVNDTSANSYEDFYIDSNHTSSYAGLSYLYKRNDSSIDIESTDYLLVKFDYGVISNPGYLNTTSYTGEANSTLVAINDGKPLDQLTTQYNTFEIPEIYTNSGEYFDGINVIDFRPSVANTANPSIIFSTAPLNPSEIVNFGNTSNPLNEKKFPLPQSSLRTSIDHYLGHYESVFVDKDSNIFSIKGASAEEERYSEIPKTPAFSMRLNNVQVPPYPNLPVNISSTLDEILDRKIANEIYSNIRINSRHVKPRLTVKEVEQSQPTAYTQEAIGNLERRIEDIEYYVSLSLLESDLKDRVIASSNDPALNRFKYGFFVDDFSTNKFSDKLNPTYAATIEDDDVIPETEYFNFDSDKNDFNLDYIEYSVVSQLTATQGANNLICKPTGLVANTWLLVQQNTSGTIDNQFITMASVSSPVTLYGYFYSQHDRIEIFQGNNLILSSNSAVVLTSQDKTKMLSNTIPSAWFGSSSSGNSVGFNTSGSGRIVDLNKNFDLNSHPEGPGIRYAFKINWTHNPASGAEYSIKTYNRSAVWRYALEYPINSNEVTCTAAPNTSPVIYNGVMQVTPNVFRYTL
jgi:hypothetical protein